MKVCKYVNKCNYDNCLFNIFIIEISLNHAMRYEKNMLFFSAFCFAIFSCL